MIIHFLINAASSAFTNTGINIVTSCWFLGGVIGDQSGRMSFLRLRNGLTMLNYRISSVAKKHVQLLLVSPNLQQE